MMTVMLCIIVLINENSGYPEVQKAEVDDVHTVDPPDVVPKLAGTASIPCPGEQVPRFRCCKQG